MARSIRMAALALAIGATAFAGFQITPVLPEIDFSTGATAIALVSGAVLVLRARRKK